MGWLHTSGPDHRCRLDPDITIGAADHHLSGPHCLDAALGQKLDPIGFFPKGMNRNLWLAVLNGSASDQLEPFEKEAVEKANTTKVQELLGQLQ